MATVDSYRSVFDRCNEGRATAVRVVRRVTRALFKRASRFIQWPTEDRAVSVLREFKSASGFPKIIGAIGGNHIRINAPKKNAVDYINRKGYHSIQAQIVCDQKTIITHCYVGQPGSVHDLRVFRLSEVADYLNEDEKIPEDSHLLGDAAYEVDEHLLPPHRDNGHLPFKLRHSTARVTIEKCIGLLKCRMRSLNCLPMTRVDLMAEYVVACCVIHKICILREDKIFDVTIPSTYFGNENDRNFLPEDRQDAGIAKRNTISDSLYGI